ncbi:hypothetical protein SAMN05192533_101360 [Mesobacillus persicus]|uniref:Uncharacterized protein n=1 Tax=Mesobacillus persicus TaxID=930146 RepID=A0A1H7WDQ3_9BACI|nr:hypothetical protein [Mesobacillus persicus]SEM19205.1 hypothetical protein SAMN05192533_101360 [Mesobacillus persicus]
MKEILQQIKDDLEKCYSNPESFDLDRSIQQLQFAIGQNGDKGTTLEDTMTALTQAKHALPQLENAGDVASSAAFGQAFNALEHALKSYMDTDNDPV